MIVKFRHNKIRGATAMRQRAQTVIKKALGCGVDAAYLAVACERVETKDEDQALAIGAELERLGFVVELKTW